MKSILLIYPISEALGASVHVFHSMNTVIHPHNLTTLKEKFWTKKFQSVDATLVVWNFELQTSTFHIDNICGEHKCSPECWLAGKIDEGSV